ncbi:beta-1,3-glucanase family protein [Streptomyces sp. NPDC088350]|uniref:beta-1,3-glucanase family protein n=1 Tax=Streptomyces sp. NPDC088350 TaxID=3365854 RepID=UPI0037F1A5FE
MHAATADGRAYGFAFDDVADLASYIRDTAPTGIRLTLTPFWALGVRGRSRRRSVVVWERCVGGCRAGTGSRPGGAGCGARPRRCGCGCCRVCWSPVWVWRRW